MAKEDVSILLKLKDEFSKPLKKALGQSEKATKKSTRNMNLMWTELGSAMLIAERAVQAMRGAFEFAREGAELERLRSSGERLANSMSLNMDQIVSSMKRASDGTLSEMDAISAANRALQLNVAQTPEEFEELTKAAIALGRAMGRDASESINDIVTGIGRMSPLILDNLGIVTEGGKVYDRYAASLGKSTAELTDAEKKQALLNQTIEDGAALLDKQGQLIEDQATKFEQFEATVEDAKRVYQEWAADALLPALDTFVDNTHAIETLNAALDAGVISQDEFGRALIDLRHGVVQAEEVINELTPAIKESGQSADEFGLSAERAAFAASRVEQEAGDAALEVGGLSSETKTASAAFDDLDSSIGRTIEGMIEDMQFFAAGGAEIAVMADLVREAFAGGNIPLSDAVRLMEGLQAETLQVKQDAGLISFEEAKEQAEEWGIALDNPLADMEQIATIYDRITKDRKVEIEYQLSTTGVGPGGGVTAQQHGGPLAPIALVGEKGPEMIIGGTVVPAGITRKLMDLGLKPKGFQTGGVLIDGLISRETISTRPKKAPGTGGVTQGNVSSGLREALESAGSPILAPSQTQQAIAQVVAETVEIGQEAAQETVEAAVTAVVDQQTQSFNVQFEKQSQEQQNQTRLLEEILITLEQQADVEELRTALEESRDTSGF